MAKVAGFYTLNIYMIFNSYIFLFGFLPIVLVGFWLLKNKQQRYLWLTVAGYIFYGYWNWKFLFLMFATTGLDFLVAKKIGSLKDNKPLAKKYLAVSIIANLGALAFFKYANFALQSTAGLAHLFGLNLNIPIFNIILPISISFYTFQAISYGIDVYRGKAEVITNFFEYSTYIALFPHLVAGPIVRYTHIAPDLKAIDKPPRSEFFYHAIYFFVIGLAKKVIIADSIASIVDPMLANYANLTSLGAWLAILGYTFQLYFDFSGYSDMAVGLAYTLGFHFPQNFNSPYKSVNINDFWRRWHMSLSAWLRDYLYIPLGGSRISPNRTYINLLLTMFLGGLWHGANWTFAVWGLYHGLLLALHKLFERAYEKIPVLIQRALTFFLVMIGWVFFRSTDFTMAAFWLKKMFILSISELTWTNLLAHGNQFIILLAVAFFITQFLPNTFELKQTPKLKYAVGLAAVFVICLVLLNYKQSVFIYYQF